MFIKRTVQTVFLMIVVATTGLFGVSEAIAASFNNHPNDFATLRVANFTENPNCTNCWASSVNADSGEKISFAIYYHNNSNETAENVRVTLSPRTTGVRSTHTFTATVRADNASTVSGSATVHLSEPQSMEYILSRTFWYPNQTQSEHTLLNGQSGTEIFGNGLLIGDIKPGFSHQGSVVARFQVDDGATGGDRPDVRTRSATNVDQDSARLRCEVDPNNSSTRVWFEYGTNSSNLNNTTASQNIGSGNNFVDVSKTIHGLNTDTRYHFRCVADNNEGTTNGSILSFRADGGGQDEPDVRTLSARNVQNTSAEIRGEVNTRGEDGEYWFQWGSSPSNLNNQTPHRFINSNTDRNVDTTLFGLSPNTQYYYRVVAENDFGIDVGGTLVFRTAGSGGSTQPEAVTNIATNVGKTSARLNGIGVNLSNKSSQGWFEWGTTRSLGNTTSRINLGTVDSNTFYQSLFGLSPNTTYYFRAVVENTNGTDRGNILNFRTDSTPVSYPPTPNEPKKVRDASIVKSLDNLDSPNGSSVRTSALRGETVRYTIEARNTGDFTLTNTEIKDRIPFYLEFANAQEQISYDDPQREVIWFVGDLRPGESRRVVLDVVVTDDAPLGSTITNVARIESERLTRNSNEVDIRVTDRIGAGFTATSTPAAVFFGGGFFPETLLGWLLLIILILILILIIRALYKNYLDARAAREARHSV